MVLCFGIFGTTAFAQEDQISDEQNILQSEEAVNDGEDNSQGDLLEPSPTPENSEAPAPENGEAPTPENSEAPTPAGKSEAPVVLAPTPAMSGAPAAAAVTASTGELKGEVLKTTGKGVTRIVVTWAYRPAADGYLLYRSQTQTGGFKVVADIDDIGAVSYTDDDLKPETVYYYKVRPYKIVDGKVVNGKVSEAVKGEPYNIPFGSFNSYDNSQLGKITFDSESFAEWGITGQRLYRSENPNDGFKLIKEIKTPLECYSDETVVPGRTYYYRLKTYFIQDGTTYESKDYANLTVTAKAIPKTKFTQYTSTAPGRIDIQWEKSEGASGYLLYRSNTANGGYSQVAKLDSGNILHNLERLEPGGVYFYKIRPYFEKNGKIYKGGVSDFYEVEAKDNYRCSITDISPTRLGEIKIEWGGYVCYDADGYFVYRSENPDKGYKVIARINDGSARSYTDSTVAPSKTYYYKVRHYQIEDGNLISKTSSRYAFAKSASIPTSYINNVVDTDLGAVRVYWEYSQGVTGYYIYRSETEVGGYSIVYDAPNPSILNFEDTTVAPNKTYYYKVKPYFESNGKVYKGKPSTYYSFKTQKIEKSSIKNAVSTSPTSITVNWSISYRASGYYIYRSETEVGGYSKIKTVKGYNNTEYKDNNLAPNKKYYYKVRPFFVSGSNTYNGPVSSFYGAKTQKIEAAQIKYTASPSPVKILVEWTASGNADGYYLYRSETQVGGYTRIKDIKDGKTKSFVDSTVVPGGSYYYKLIPYCKTSAKVYKGLVSNPVSGHAQKMKAPKNLYAEKSNTRMYIEWDKVDGAAKYDVYRSETQVGGYSKIITTSNNMCYDENVQSGKTYYYKVRGIAVVNGKSYNGFITGPFEAHMW